MKILGRLVSLHKILFTTAVLFTFLSVVLNLYWNKFLAGILDILGDTAFYNLKDKDGIFFAVLTKGIFIILLYTLSEYLTSCRASFLCEMFAHEIRMGYAGYYLQSDVRILAGLNVGEEQSAMQNELKDISDYFKENLFSFIRQFVAFTVTAFFLLCQNFKLAALSILPAVPLIIYCSFSSKVIKDYTEQCQNSRKKINGLADTILDLFPIIRIYGAYRLLRGAVEERISEWETVNVKKERISAGLLSLSGALSFLPLLFLLVFGGLMVINGEISTGIFYIFINLSGNISGFLQNMQSV